MTYDAADGYVLYFGGGYGGGQSQNDTWIFQYGTWTNITSNLTLAPCSRANPQLAYDAADGYVLLYGGYTDVGASPGASYALNDTWTYAHGTWTNITNTVRGNPGNLLWDELTYDWADGYAVLYGGTPIIGGAYVSYGPMTNDTWVFHGGIWTNITNSAGRAPLPRNLPSIAYDSADGYLVLFGGWNLELDQMFNDTWTFSGGTWTVLNTSVAPPPMRGAALAYEPRFGSTRPAGGLVLFGGNLVVGGTIVNTTWIFSAGAWTDVTGTVSNAPPPRFSAGVANVSNTAEVIVSDGCSQPGCPIATDLGDTWIFYNLTWTEYGVTAHLEPSPRQSAAMAYDPADQCVVYFGGGWEGGQSVGDTWTFAHNVWTNLTSNLSTAPSARESAMMTWDAADGYMLLYGGFTNASPVSGGPHALGDSWAFVHGLWSNITSPGGPNPAPRSQAAMAYDALDGYVVLFGGEASFGGANASLNDTWTFLAGNWVNATATVGSAPSPRSAASMVFDGADGYLVLFGGWDPPIGAILNDTWVFSHGTWSPSSAQGGPPPSVGPAMAFDAPGKYVLMFGGAAPSQYGGVIGHNITWAWANGSWTDLSSLVAKSPPARYFAGLSNTSDPGTIVLAGGCMSDPCPSYFTLGDTWTYNWSSVNASLTLSPVPVRVNQTATFTVFAAGGTQPYRYSYWGLPPGCASADTAELTCIPTAVGNYSVVATVQDTTGHSSRVGGALEVAPESVFPVVRLAVSLSEVDVTEHVIFSATASLGLPPYSFAYSGLPAGCSSQNQATLSCAPQHAGVYPVEVTATDGSGVQAVSQVTLTVDPLPAIQVDRSYVTGTVPLDVSLNATVSGGVAPLREEWTFGDGGVGRSLSVAHTYLVPGTYNVTVWANDSHGFSASTRVLVVVNPAPITPPGGGSSEPPSSIWSTAFAVGLLLGLLVAAGVTIWGVRRIRRAREGSEWLRKLEEQESAAGADLSGAAGPPRPPSGGR